MPTFGPYIEVVKLAGEGFRVGMGELIKLKDDTYMASVDDKDLEGLFAFLLNKWRR